MATDPLLYSAKYTSNMYGQIFLTGPISLSGFSMVDFEIVQNQLGMAGFNVEVTMGKISGWTLAKVVDNFPLPLPPGYMDRTLAYLAQNLVSC